MVSEDKLMDEVDLAGLEPVTDPALIAKLELPQSTINKADEAGDGPAYSQSAMDAFDRAIATAERLKTHPGYGAAVGSAFDPQSWGSFNPVTGQAFGGTGARDFGAELEAMKAQVFLPMVQSMKGMGALSNAEGQKLTDAIGALDTGMSEDAFRTSLDRIIGDLTTYRSRGAPKEGENAATGGAVAPGTDASAPPVPPGGPVEVSKTGEMRFATEQDKAFAAQAQALFDQGATREQLNQLAVQQGYMPYGADLDQAIDYRNRGGKGARIAAPESGYKGPSTLGALAATPVGSFFASAGNALTAGTMDEIVGMTGGDQEQAQAAKEVMRDANPMASFAGELTGGVLAATGAGRVPGLAGRALVADTAYGAAYGAGEANDNRLGGAVTGAGAAAAGSFFGGKLMDRLSKPFVGPAAAERVAKAKKFNIDLPLGASGRTAAVLEKGLDILPGSAGVMQRGRDVLGEQVSDAVKNVADSYGVPASFSAMGEAAQRGARKWISRFEEVSGKAYDAIPISPQAPASLASTRSTLTNLTSRFQSNPKLAAAMKNTRLSSYMDALGDDASQLSWEDLKAFRSRIGEEIGDQRFSDGTLKSELRGLYAALSEDMKASAAAQGPAAVRAFERANTMYRQGQERIDNALTSLLGDAGKSNPEAAAAKIQQIARSGKSSSDLTKLAEIRKSMPAAEWGEMSNGIIRLLGQPVNSEGREFSAETFVRTFNDMDPSAKNLLFGAEHKALRQNLEEFAGVMDDLAKSNALRNTSGTAGVANIAALASLLPTALVSLPAAGALATQTVGSHYLARAWTNPRFVQWATGYTKMLRGAARAGTMPNGQNMSRHAELLRKVAVAEPAIAQEALGIRQMLLGAANDNAAQIAGRSAAAGQNESEDNKPSR